MVKEKYLKKTNFHLLIQFLVFFSSDLNERMNDALGSIVTAAVGGAGRRAMHSITHSLTHLLTHWIIYPITHSLIRSHIHWHIYWITHSLIQLGGGSNGGRSAFEKRVAINVMRNISQVSDSRIIPFLSLLSDINTEPIIEGTHSCTHSLTHSLILRVKTSMIIYWQRDY